MWYLTLSEEGQMEVLAKTEVCSNSHLPAGNWLLPEFEGNAGALLGKALPVLLIARLASTDLALSDDVALLETVRAADRLPDLSSGQLAQLRCPFVDPADPTQR